MKLAAVALDYDGTIATDGVLNPMVRDAIGEIRRRSVAVLLVTGRRIQDLRRAAGDLNCFDVVVGENGAVLEFPASGRHMLLSHRPAPAVVAELQRRQVDIAVGECVIEADAAAAPVVLDVVRGLEQPLILAFNRGRLMVLPQAVAKSTGLRQALFALRLSVHNTIAIGDAENDHDLLDACEVGVAVSWGSAALRAVADEVIQGTGPEAVAGYLRRVCCQPRLSAAQMGRRRLLLGHEHNGREVSLAVRGRNVLIAGEPGSGKSWVAGLLCEQLILQGYSLCIIDPEGDYRSLEALPTVVVLGGDDPPPRAREIAHALRHPDVSVVIDLSKMKHHAKVEYLDTLLPLLATVRRRTGLPHRIILDEAHYFLGKDADRLIDSTLSGYTLVTYRISGLDPSIRTASDAVVIVTRETDPMEIETLRTMCVPEPASNVPPAIFRDLATNEAVLLPRAEEAAGHVRRFHLATRLTAHVRHQSKYLDMPVPESQGFVFWGDGRPGPRAHTLKAFLGLLHTLPESHLEGHLRRHDFSRWINDVFRDHPLASHLRSVESRIDTDVVPDVVPAVMQAIRARYEIPADRELPRSA
jgi:hydroxymethylpyrimidine pyrophosphatase-like HAD family hydrolase